MRVLLTPRMIGVHLLALVLVATAGALALWQYTAWQARRDAEAVDLTLLEPMAMSEVMGPDDAFPGGSVGQPVALSGTWVPEASVLVSDREQDGVAGYWVVTPLIVEGTGSALPVVRGWTADAQGVPAAPRGAASFVGYLQPTEGRTITDADPSDDVLPQLRTADLVQRVSQDLYGAYAVETDDVRDAAAPDNAGSTGLDPATLEQLPETGGFTALRNLLYAIEWWVFGAFAVFIWWRYVSDQLAFERAASEPPPDDLPPEPVGERPVVSGV